jgi:ribosomal protein S18 acetylase RimI-like enzyme
LPRACLEHTIARASASGDYDTIELHVDSASPTGATRLYERVGFGLDKTFAAYERAAG